jgi:hypothetical protein
MQESIRYHGKSIGDFGGEEYPEASEAGPKVLTGMKRL